MQVFAADPPAASAVKGLWLLTDYPSQTVRPGEVANIRFKLQNAGLAPETLALSVDGVPDGWKADVLGGGQPVAAAMPGINESTSLQLRVDVPKDAKPGSQTMTVQRQGRGAVDRPAGHPHHRQRDAGQAHHQDASCPR